MDIVIKALTAKRESKHVEFKQHFDPNSLGEWCEVVKDLAAIANSGGGIIVFGLDSLGTPTGESTKAIASIDPADIANKITRYTGAVDFDFEAQALEKDGHKLAGFVIQPASIPLVFERPGTYETAAGKHYTAFSIGTVYFRHSAKSEPGTTEDIRQVIERQVERVRKSWINGVRKVVRAPEGSQFIAVQPASSTAKQLTGTQVRAVNDPRATPVRLTRDPAVTAGLLVHEEVSDGIFDEINNVIDANGVLARGQQNFMLDQSVYYRIYAERHRVRQPEERLFHFLHYGVVDFYAPALFWALKLPDRFIADTVVELYRTNHQTYSLMRVSMLLGLDFCEWLFGKWQEKWKNHPQPLSYYHTLQQMISDLRQTDARLMAARLSLTSHFIIEGDTQIEVKDILEKPDQAAILLSRACMRVFHGENEYRSIARSLDYFAYGPEVQRRATAIAKAVMQTVDGVKPGKATETTESGE